MSSEGGQEIDRGEWGARFLEFIIPRLAGDDADKEQSLEMIFSALEKRYREGLKDAAYIASKLAERDEKSRRVASVLASSFDKLEQISISKDDGRRLAAMDERRAASEEATPAPGIR